VFALQSATPAPRRRRRAYNQAKEHPLLFIVKGRKKLKSFMLLGVGVEAAQQ